MPKLRPDQYLSCILLLCVATLIPIATPAEAKVLKPITVLEPLPILLENFLYPVKKIDSISTPTITAKAAIIYDPQNAAILYQKSIDEKLPQASLTKLMTALVAVELYPMDDIVSVTLDSVNTENNVMGLQPGEKISVESLLKGLLIFSANDAALALQHHHPQGPDAFIQAMNTKAHQLHLSNSSFQNTPGFDDISHHSTAFDLAVLSKEVLSYPSLANIMKTQITTVTDINQTITHELHSTNQLFNKLSGLVAGKTGNTPLAGECLITEVERNNHPIITVVLGSKDRFSDTIELVDWVYNHFTWESPVQGEIGKEEIRN